VKEEAFILEHTEIGIGPLEAADDESVLFGKRCFQPPHQIHLRSSPGALRRHQEATWLFSVIFGEVCDQDGFFREVKVVSDEIVARSRFPYRCTFVAL
jgi:hypothetical protein